MYPSDLLQLLDKGGVSPDNVAKASELCGRWFAAEPALPSFVFRAIFTDLTARWPDPQGLRTEHWEPFDKKLLPELKRVAGLVANQPNVPPAGALESLVRVLQTCETAASQAVP
jgi:hypothetical protein